MASTPSNPDRQVSPVSELGWIRGAYYQHLREWLYAQGRRWEPSMLATKLGRDIEAQMAREKRTFELANLMRAVVSLHADLVFKGFSLSGGDQACVPRDVLANANPRLLELRPRLRALLDDPMATKDDLLHEFDVFVLEEKLNEKTVVLMNCPSTPRWALQNI